jgi:ParB family chromosome partitioning protein
MAVFDFLRDSTSRDSGKKLEEIQVSKIVPNPNQPRKTFDDESIAELAQSIRQGGLIQPLVVRRQGDVYELIAGERRLRAIKLLELERVTCIVQNDIVDESSAMMALIENLQRENLNFFEEAQCYSDLIDTYSLTQEALAEKLGKSQSSIANKLRVLKLSPAVKEAMTDAGLTERHARALLRIADENEQLAIIKEVKDKGMSVKETEQRVEKQLNKLYDERKDGAKPRPVMLRMIKDYRLFMNSINSAVEQLRYAGLIVDVRQADRDDGVDISISVTRPQQQ